MTIKNNIHALILVGGKSTRMMEDKSKINYHGTDQTTHLYNLLKNFTTNIFISNRSEQKNLMHLKNFNSIEDHYPSIGPISGILSGFKMSPNTPWLVIAVDMPYITSQAIETLIKNYDENKIATAFYNNEKKWPEPLFTIYSPLAYPKLLEYFNNGYKCPRKLISGADIKLIKLANSIILENANTQLDREKIFHDLNLNKE